ASLDLSRASVALGVEPTSSVSGVLVDEQCGVWTELHQVDLVEGKARAAQGRHVGNVPGEDRHRSGVAALMVQRDLPFPRPGLCVVGVAWEEGPQQHRGVHVRDLRRLVGPSNDALGIDEEADGRVYEGLLLEL